MNISLCSQGGWVVCEEDKDELLAAWEEEIVEQKKREEAVSSAFTSAHISLSFLALNILDVENSG